MKLDYFRKFATFALVATLYSPPVWANSTNSTVSSNSVISSICPIDSLELKLKTFITDMDLAKVSNDWFSVSCELNHIKDIEKSITNLDDFVSSSINLSNYVWDYRLTSCEFFKRISTSELKLSDNKTEKIYNLLFMADFHKSLKRAEKTLNHVRMNETLHESSLIKLYEMSLDLTNFYGLAQAWYGDIKINVPEGELTNLVLSLENKSKYKQAFILAYTFAQKGDKEKAGHYLNQAKCYLGSISDEDFLKREGWKSQKIKIMTNK